MKKLFRFSFFSLLLLFFACSAIAREWRRFAIQSGDSFYFSDVTSGFPHLRAVNLGTLQEVGEASLGGEANFGRGSLLFVHAYDGHVYVGRYGWSQGANQLSFERLSPDLAEIENVVEAELRNIRTDSVRAFYRRFLLFRKEEQLHVIDLYNGATVYSHPLPSGIENRGEAALAVDPASGHLGMIIRFEGYHGVDLNFANYTLRATIGEDGKISLVEESFSAEPIFRGILPFRGVGSGGQDSAQLLPGSWTIVSDAGFAYDLETRRLVGSLGGGILGIRVLEDGRLIVSRGVTRSSSSGARGTVELFGANFNLVGLREVKGRLALPVALRGNDLIVVYQPQISGSNAVSAERKFQRVPLSAIGVFRIFTPIHPMELAAGWENLRTISHDGRYIFEASRDTIALFDVAEGKILMAGRLNPSVRWISHAFYHPEDGAFYFGEQGGLLRVHPADPLNVEVFAQISQTDGPEMDEYQTFPVKNGVIVRVSRWDNIFVFYGLADGSVLGHLTARAGVYLPRRERLLLRSHDRWHMMRLDGSTWVEERSGPPLPGPDAVSAAAPRMAVFDHAESLLWDGAHRDFIDLETLGLAAEPLPPAPPHFYSPLEGVTFGLWGDGTYLYRLREEREMQPHGARSLVSQFLEKLNQAGEVVDSRVLLDRVSFVPLYPKQVGVWEGTPYMFSWDGNIPRLYLFDDQLRTRPLGSGGLPRAFQFGDWRFSLNERLAYTGGSLWYWTNYTGWHYRHPTGRSEDEFWVWFSHRQWGWTDNRFFPFVYKPLRNDWLVVSTAPAEERPTRFRSLRYGYMFDGHSGFAPTEIHRRNLVLNPGTDEELWEFSDSLSDYIRVSFTEAGEYVFFWLNYSYERLTEVHARVTFAYEGMVEDGVLNLYFDGLTGGTFAASAIFIGERGQRQAFTDSGRFRIE